MQSRRVPIHAIRRRSCLFPGVERFDPWCTVVNYHLLDVRPEIPARASGISTCGRTRGAVALFSSSTARRDLTASAPLLRHTDDGCTHTSDPTGPAPPYSPREYQLGASCLTHSTRSLAMAPRGNPANKVLATGSLTATLDGSILYKNGAFPPFRRPLDGILTDVMLWSGEQITSLSLRPGPFARVSPLPVLSPRCPMLTRAPR